MLLTRRIEVRPEHGIFTLFDPTCDEPGDLRPAITGAIREIVGWAPSAVSVAVVCDLVAIEVTLMVAVGYGQLRVEPEVLREGSVAFPSGQLAVDLAAEAEVRLGFDLPAGPGTYAVRVTGTGRAEARRRREALFTTPEPDFDALAGVETYQVELRHVSPEPRWPDDDEED